MNKEHQEDKFKEECGVFGIYGHDDAAALTVLGLHALQHRGQEATGIVSFNNNNFYAHRAAELVGKAFGDPDVMARLKGFGAIGHNRYSTTGETIVRNIQPLYADLAFGGFGIAHNGNLTNAHTLRQELVQSGALFQTTTDTEVIIHLMARAKKDSVVDRLIYALSHVKGAYSIVACASGKIIGVRDPFGIRPLVLGRVGDAHVFASESCAFDVIGATFVRDIEPGEMVTIDDKGVHSCRPFGESRSRFCVFEYIYFARPDSFVEGHSVYEMRKKIGKQLANEAPCDGADIVVPVPDSGVPAAIGYAEESGIPFELGIIRSHYIGRTFIQPTDKVRSLGVTMKHNANKPFLKGKKVVLVDDSIVRGTTSKRIVDMVKEAGAKEVHLRISCPPTSFSCFYGIDTPSKSDLVANRMSIDEIADYIGADSLSYLSVDGLYRAAGQEKRDKESKYCDACFTGDYAVELTDYENKLNQSKVTNLNERRQKKRS
jgi:amidophosphoribosyltransferase